MPYPIELPKMKHNIMFSKSVFDDVDHDVNFLDSNSSLFHAVEKSTIIEVVKDKYFELPVYSYPDSPHPPLSRDLVVIGYAEETLNFVRKFCNEDDNDDFYNSTTNIFQKCTISVKRGDGVFQKQFKSKHDFDCSMKFASFMKFLYSKQFVAIIGMDKYQRFGVLRPMSDYTLVTGTNLSTEHGGDEEGQNFAAQFYTGRFDEAKDSVRNFAAVNHSTSSEFPFQHNDKKQKMTVDDVHNTANNDIDEFWVPPGTSDNDNNNNFNVNDEYETNYVSNVIDEQETNYISNVNVESSYHGFADDVKFDNETVANTSALHANSGAAAAADFYGKLRRTLDTRTASRLYHMRNFNGWVKGTQIQELNPKTAKKLRVLDLACGKGGDLGKWVLHPRGLGNYVGIDVALGSLVDAAERARKMKQKFTNQKCTFTCADLGSDVPGRYKTGKHKKIQKLLSWSLPNDTSSSEPEFTYVRGGGISLQDKFDVVSIQFAIHYMMQTRKRARRFFKTVSQLLEVGGNLIATTIDARVVIDHLLDLGLNLHCESSDDSTGTESTWDAHALGGDPVIAVGDGACKIRFEPKVVKQIFSPMKGDLTKGDIDESLFGLEYTFTLVEGSDHASGVGDAVNLPEWLIPIPVLKALGKEVGLEMEYAQNFHEFYTKRSDPNEYSSAHGTMYNMKVLDMNGSISKYEWEISRLYVAIKFKKVREVTQYLDDDDDLDEDDDDDEEEEALDPVMKEKLFPMALMKAKKLAGNENWANLSSEEKSRLTEIELRKMIPKK